MHLYDHRYSVMPTAKTKSNQKWVNDIFFKLQIHFRIDSQIHSNIVEMMNSFEWNWYQTLKQFGKYWSKSPIFVNHEWTCKNQFLPTMNGIRNKQTNKKTIF